ncbi:MAG: hypothetical protein ACFFCP_13010 [Promethearchaeota archaeon]
MKQEDEERKQNGKDVGDRGKATLGFICFGIILIVLMAMVSAAYESNATTAVVILLMLLFVLCFGWLCTVDDKGAKPETHPESRLLIKRDFPSRDWITERPKEFGTKKPIPGLIKGISEVKQETPEEDKKVVVKRGGEFIGNRMRFKVKVLNESPFIISDVTVYLLSFPHEALRLAGDEDRVFFSKIEPGGFRSPTFDFMPTQDCVRGDIVAGVSYIDMRGRPQALTVKPFIIRSVCDLLLPEQVTPEEFELKLKDLECGEISLKINEWTPREMIDKVLRILDESNFYEVRSDISVTDSVVFGRISGFAKGKYTGKHLGVEISVTGPEKAKGATCKIQVSGEDQAMILPAIDDLRERLNAWLCPRCTSSLTLENVEDLRRGKVIQCPFCGVSIGR